VGVNVAVGTNVSVGTRVSVGVGTDASVGGSVVVGGRAVFVGTEAAEGSVQAPKNNDSALKINGLGNLIIIKAFPFTIIANDDEYYTPIPILKLVRTKSQNRVN